MQKNIKLHRNVLQTLPCISDTTKLRLFLHPTYSQNWKAAPYGVHLH